MANRGQYTISAGGVNGTLIEVEITRRLNEISTAVCIAKEYVPTNALAILYYMGVKEVFRGYVTYCKKLDTGPAVGSKYELEIEAVEGELRYKYIERGDKSALFVVNTKKVVNDEPKVLGFFIQHILYNSGWSDASPSMVTTNQDGERLPSMGFSSCTVYNALNRMICQEMGWGIWYDSVNKRISYGEYRKHWSPMEYPCPSDVRATEQVRNYDIDRVIVYNDDKSLKAQIGTGSRTICYRYSQCSTQEELDSVASRIWKERSDVSARYEIDFSPDFTDVREGDVVNIWCGAINMPLKNNIGEVPDGYGVKDVKNTPDKVVVGVGATNVTIFDILNDRLSVIDGEACIPEIVEYPLEWKNVEAGELEGQYGVQTDIEFEVTDGNIFGGVNIMPIMGPYGTTDDGLRQRVYVKSGVTEELTIASGAGTSITVLMEDDVLPTDFDWGEVLVQYTFDETSVDAVAAVTVEWGSAEVVDDQSDFDVRNRRTTVFQKFYIGETRSWTADDITVMIENVGGGTLKLNDVIVKGALFYYTQIVTEDESEEEIDYPTTMELKIDDDEWVEINDQEQITYEKILDVGKHIVSVRSIDEGAVQLTLSYARFNEPTEIIE